MEKKSKKQFIIFLLSFFIIGTLSFVVFYIFHPSYYKSNTPTLKPYHFSGVNSDKIEQYSYDYPTKLDILPKNYSEIVKNGYIDIGKDNVAELLNYGETVVKLKDGTDYNSLLELLSKNNTPVLINDQLLSTIYLSQLDTIRKDFFQKEIVNNLPNYKKKYNRSIFAKAIYSFHKDFMDELDKTFSLCTQIEKCIETSSKLNEEQKEFFRLIGFNDFTNRLSILTLLETSYTSSEFNPLGSEVLDDNDMKVIQQWGMDSDKLINEKNLFIEGKISNIRADIDLRLLDGMIAYSSYLRDESKSKGLEIDKVNSLSEDLSLLKTSILGKNTHEREFLSTLLLSQSFLTNYSDVLLTTIRENNENTIYVTPIIEHNSPKTLLKKDNILDDYDVKPLALVSGGIRIPILMYHHIGTTNNPHNKGLYVSPEIFEKQVAYLVRKNYHIINTSELFSILESGKQPSQKTVMLTFDDSQKSHYESAFPILKKYDIPGVFFVIASRSFLSPSQIKEMSDYGMDIQSHSNTHIDFSKATDEMISNEATVSKGILERITGRKVSAIAYPGCLAKNNTFGIVSGSGYKLGFSCGKYIDTSFKKRLYISRVHVFDDMESFIKMLSVGL
ncbi:polysaccharide deacetylase family protein [Candidatus Dojkabacteria bacterium]|uniref:Polysaccharide deacetylase family protein n=1 Tax=Candidatus Dojkabacteria bacterium TaxID=2099670 RepID=A0A847D109_9BACT|nr:polysaccharide deacetylase family protein [Candidatus Dojkabacteria bacterium]